MALISPHSRLRRTGHAASLLTGALFCGAAHAQGTVYSTTIVPINPVPVATFTADTTAAGTPTFKESSAVGGTGNAVPYNTEAFTAPAASTYRISTTVTSGYTYAENFIQLLYAPTFTASTPATNLQALYQPRGNSISYFNTLTANQQIALVDTGISNTDTGVAQTSIYDVGSLHTAPDASATGTSQTLTIPDSGAVGTFNGITIDNLVNTYAGDLLGTLTHNGITVDLFDHVGADNNPTDPNYNYGQGSAAAFDGGNYTFSQSGANLSAVPDFATIPDGTYAASGNASTGYDTAHAGNTLAAFAGQSLSGDWVLKLADEQPDDTSSFMGFSLDITPAPEPSAWASLLIGALGLGGLALRARRRTRA